MDFSNSPLKYYLYSKLTRIHCRISTIDSSFVIDLTRRKNSRRLIIVYVAQLLELASQKSLVQVLSCPHKDFIFQFLNVLNQCRSMPLFEKEQTHYCQTSCKQRVQANTYHLNREGRVPNCPNILIPATTASVLAALQLFGG